MKLPETIAAYYAAKNRRDIEAMAATFTDRAVVRDEGAAYEGRAAIKAWMEDTTRRYGVTATPIATRKVGARVVVDADVAGNFPGSPAKLTYSFELDGAGISALEIG